MLDGLVSGVMDLIGGERRNKAQQELADSQMDFQRLMRNTSYQAAVEDLEAAGLNKMLAYHNGGAATPSGAMPTIENTIGPAVNTALSAQRTKAEIENMKEQNRNIAAQTGKLKADTNLSKAQSLLTTEQTILNANNAQLAKLRLPGARQESNIDQSFAGTLSRLFNRFNPLANFAARSLN